MSSENKKSPKVITGALIFNDKGELFLMRSPKWQNKYVCPGGTVEYGEKIIDNLKREVREETNMKISDPEFLSVTEGINLGDKYSKKSKHLVFINYKVSVKEPVKVKLNDEGVKYRWLKPGEWLKKDLGDFTREVLEKNLPQEHDYEGMYKRALADYQNLLKRTAREKDEFVKYAHEGLLHEILPVYDNLKMAVAHADAKTHDSWLEGVKFVVKQFKDILTGLGVEEIETVGREFNHNTMEAVEGKGEKVAKEVRPGYKLKGKVIVPAKVVVGGEEKSASNENTGGEA